MIEAIPNRVRRAVLAVLACVSVVVFAIAFIDRPASSWAHAHLCRPAFLNRVTHAEDPLPLAATLGIVGSAIAAVIRGRRPGEKSQTVIAASVAVLVASEIKDQLKNFFGRPWPESWTSENPSWISTHASGFQFFHGGRGWESFPSGHMAQMAALAAVIWLRLPRFRWLGVALTCLVAITLWAADYHFVGDIIAGACLGTACGIGMVSVACRP
jgi:membrane-associated phospholipid phosphatase